MRFFFEHELIRNPPVWDGDMSCKKSPPYFDHQMSQGFSYSNRFEEFLLIDVYLSRKISVFPAAPVHC